MTMTCPHPHTWETLLHDLAVPDEREPGKWVRSGWCPYRCGVRVVCHDIERSEVTGQDLSAYSDSAMRDRGCDLIFWEDRADKAHSRVVAFVRNGRSVYEARDDNSQDAHLRLLEAEARDDRSLQCRCDRGACERCGAYVPECQLSYAGFCADCQGRIDSAAEELAERRAG